MHAVHEAPEFPVDLRPRHPESLELPDTEFHDFTGGVRVLLFMLVSLLTSASLVKLGVLLHGLLRDDADGVGVRKNSLLLRLREVPRVEVWVSLARVTLALQVQAGDAAFLKAGEGWGADVETPLFPEAFAGRTAVRVYDGGEERVEGRGGDVREITARCGFVLEVGFLGDLAEGAWDGQEDAADAVDEPVLEAGFGVAGFIEFAIEETEKKVLCAV